MSLLSLWTGKKDVADQIEDEEQVLGLKGDEEKEENDQGMQEEKEGGMEMQVRHIVLLSYGDCAFPISLSFAI